MIFNYNSFVSNHFFTKTYTTELPSLTTIHLIIIKFNIKQNLKILINFIKDTYEI